MSGSRVLGSARAYAAQISQPNCIREGGRAGEECVCVCEGGGARERESERARERERERARESEKGSGLRSLRLTGRSGVCSCADTRRVPGFRVSSPGFQARVRGFGIRVSGIGLGPRVDLRPRGST